jgi:transposase
LTTKIHAIVDALGNPVAFSLTGGQVHDLGQAQPLLAKVLAKVKPKAFLADKAYDANALIEMLESRKITPVIPSKSNRVEPRDTDYALYRERNLVERFFNTIKHFRGIATRYDKLANTFLGAIHLIAAVIWLN